MSKQWNFLPSDVQGSDPGFVVSPARESGQWRIQDRGFALPGGGDVHWSGRVDVQGNLLDSHATVQLPGDLDSVHIR